MQGRVTNTGDMALTDAVAFGGIDVFNEAPKIFNNYVEFLSGGFKFGPAGPFSIEPGESVLFTIATWDPWPIAGDPGDPVETGEYVLPISALSLTYDTFTPFTEYPVDMSGAGNFVWQVQEPGSTGGTPTDSAVPEPLTATLSLLAIGGAIVSLRRRPELRN